MAKALKDYLPETLGLLRSQIAMRTGIVTSGTLTSAALRLFLALSLAKVLTDDEYGAFVVFCGLMDIVAICCESGINAVLVRFVAAHPDRRPAPIVLRCLGIKGALCLLALPFLALYFPIFMRDPKILPEWGILYPVAGLSAIFLSLNTFAMAISQARERYIHYAIQAVLINAIRLLVLIPILSSGASDARTVCLLFFAVPPVAVLIGGLFVWGALRGTGRLEPARVAMRELLAFMAPLAGIQVLTIISMRIDVIMLKEMTDDLTVAANYGVAYQIAYVFPLLSSALFTVLLPKVSAMRTAGELARYRRQVLHLYPLAVALSIIGLFLGPLVIRLLFADRFAAALPIVRVIILNVGIYAVMNPLALILYSLRQPYRLVPIHLAQLIIFVGLNLLLIPRFQGLGPAIGMTVVNVLGIAWILPLSASAIARRRSHEEEAAHA